MMITKIIKENNNTRYTDEVIQYGLKAIALNCLNILTILIIGLISGNCFFSFVFLVSFIPLRLVLGGYHCDSVLKCEIYFTIIYTFIQIINFTSLKKIMIFLFFLTFCLLLEKIFKDKLHLTSKSILILLIYGFILIILKNDTYYFYIVLSSYTLNIILRIIKDDEVKEAL
jgi:accessory gene regulator B